AGERVWHDVLLHNAVRTDESVTADVAELVHSAKGADIGPIFDDYVACESDAVAENHVVADPDIVRHVGIGHQQIVAPDAGDQSPTLGSAMNGYEFADPVSIADASLGALALILQVLRRHSNRTVREKNVVRADGGGPFEIVMRHQPRTLTDFDLRAHDTKRTDFGALRDTRQRVDDGGRINGHAQAGVAGVSSLSASLHIISASATS